MDDSCWPPRLPEKHGVKALVLTGLGRKSVQSNPRLETTTRDPKDVRVSSNSSATSDCNGRYRLTLRRESHVVVVLFNASHLLIFREPRAPEKAVTLGSLLREAVELLRDCCLYMSTMLARLVELPREEDRLLGAVEKKEERLCRFVDKDRADGRYTLTP